MTMDITNELSGDIAQCRIIFTGDAFEPETKRKGQCWRNAYCMYKSVTSLLSDFASRQCWEYKHRKRVTDKHF